MFHDIFNYYGGAPEPDNPVTEDLILLLVVFAFLFSLILPIFYVLS